MKLDPSTDLTFTRTINAPCALLWECWTKPEHIQKFFVPKPNGIDACQIDLRVGGRFNTTMNVEGKTVENEGVHLEVTEGERVVFTDTYSEGWKPAADPFLTAIIEFADDGNGGTTYTATARHRTPAACQSHEEMGFYDGWGTVAEQLEAYALSLD
ncbi:MAG: SRPBCC family protein [Pseudomonadota bacterium]